MEMVGGEGATTDDAYEGAFDGPSPAAEPPAVGDTHVTRPVVALYNALVNRHPYAVAASLGPYPCHRPTVPVVDGVYLYIHACVSESSK